jgi:hypothetical protein
MTVHFQFTLDDYRNAFVRIFGKAPRHLCAGGDAFLQAFVILSDSVETEAVWVSISM